MAESCYISQTNSKWRNLRLGSSTMGRAGCIVSCAAIGRIKDLGY